MLLVGIGGLVIAEESGLVDVVAVSPGDGCDDIRLLPLLAGGTDGTNFLGVVIVCIAEMSFVPAPGGGGGGGGGGEDDGEY